MEEPDRAAEIADRARRLLAMREHSRMELQRKLQARGFDLGPIASALNRLVEEGALDEVRMIEHYIAERAARGFGPLRIRAELAAKGLPETLIDPQLALLRDDWVAYLAEIYDRRFGTAPVLDRADYARRGRFLEQRGFPPEMIRRFLRRAD